jgi:hypothetical protein
MPDFRNDQATIEATIDGAPSGAWTALSGFDGGSGDLKSRQPDGTETPLGGPPTSEDGTISRPYDPVRDPYHRWYNRRGNMPAIVTTRVHDADRRPYGPPVVYTGIVTGVALSPRDPDGNEVRTITLTVSIGTNAG